MIIKEKFLPKLTMKLKIAILLKNIKGQQSIKRKMGISGNMSLISNTFVS